MIWFYVIGTFIMFSVLTFYMLRGNSKVKKK